MKILYSFAVLSCLGAWCAPVFAAPTVPAQNGEAPKKLPLVVTGTLNKKWFSVDEPIELTVTLENTSETEVDLGPPNFTLSSEALDVRHEGNPVSQTTYGQMWLREPSPFRSPRLGAKRKFLLAPKTTYRMVFPLRRMFDLSGGGGFSVAVTRFLGQDFNSLSGLSNRNERTKIEKNVVERLDFFVESADPLHIEILPPGQAQNQQ